MTGYGMFSHMHLRGEDMTFRRGLSRRPRRNAAGDLPTTASSWQQAYRWAQGKAKVPQGHEAEVVAHFDNSPFTIPTTPIQEKEVEEGQQTFQEMMYGFVFYTQDDEQLNLTVDRKTGIAVPGPDKSASN